MNALAYQEVTHGDATGHDRRFAAEDPCPMPRPRRVLGYARVSSAEQALGTSLRDQQEAIRAYAAARGLTVTRFYVEAESAVHEKIERREQMRALMRDAKKGDLIVCDKLDRWSRDPAFAHTSVRDLLAMGATFYAVSDRCDPATDEGDTMLNFRVMFAREEHKRIKLRMVGTRRLVRDQGYYVEGTPPLGYRRSHAKGHKGIEKNVLVIVPEEADLVRRIFRLYVGGKSMTKLAEELGLKLDRVKDALHRRLYLGQIQNTRGEWIKGRHEPIVDADLFMRAQSTIDARRLGGPRPRDAVSETSTWILRDVARCLHCGAKMTAAYAGPKDERRRYYYACSKRCQSKGNRATNGSFVPVREVEEAFGPLMIARLAELREELSRTRAAEAPPAIDFSERRAKLAKRREKVLDQYESDYIDRDELRAKMARLDAERMKLDAEEDAARKPDALATLAQRRTLLRELKTLRHAWTVAAPSERRKFVGLLATAVKIGTGREPVPAWRSPEDLAVEVRP